MAQNNDSQDNGSQRRLIPSILTVVTLAITVVSVIGAGYKIDSKAEIGAKFAAENKTLPLRMTLLEKRADEASGPINSIDVIVNTQKTFIRELNEFKIEQKAVLDIFKAEQKEVLNDFKVEQREVVKDFKEMQKDIIQALKDKK